MDPSHWPGSVSGQDRAFWRRHRPTTPLAPLGAREAIFTMLLWGLRHKIGKAAESPEARREVDIQHLTPKRLIHLFQAFACDQGTGIVDQHIQQWGNNAGSLIARKSLEQVDEAFWRQVLDVNLTSCLWVTQAALPILCRNPQSSIVNMASLAGRKGGQAGSLVYAAAKGAVLTWTRSLAGDLGPRGVRVNAVAPGLILGTSFHSHPHVRGGYPGDDCRNPPGPGRLRR